MDATIWSCSYIKEIKNGPVFISKYVALFRVESRYFKTWRFEVLCKPRCLLQTMCEITVKKI